MYNAEVDFKKHLCDIKITFGIKQNCFILGKTMSFWQSFSSFNFMN
jgi:hypothetical protein